MRSSCGARRTRRATPGEQQVNRGRPLAPEASGRRHQVTRPPTIEDVEPTTQELLLTLLGVVIGAVTALAWRTSERQMRPPTTPAPIDRSVPAGVATVLGVLESSALVVDEHDEVLQASAPA